MALRLAAASASAAAPAGPALRREDWAFVSPSEAARQVEPLRAVAWSIHLMLAAVLAAVGWSFIAQVDMLARAEARVVPQGRVQQIASLEGGLLRELKVREGEAVAAGQALAVLDPTRIEAQQSESQAKWRALAASIARLEAEAQGRAPVFGAELKDASGVVQAEIESYQARQRALQEALAANQRSAALLERELKVSESMAAAGLMSEVEVMRLKRQWNELHLANQERVNRFRLEASAELTRARTELAMLQPQQTVQRDQRERSTLTSPVRGLVKNIRVHTVGGVVAAGTPVMEIVPLGEALTLEVRIKPDDIGVVKVGQRVEVKLAAYDAAVYGSLRGKIETIAPDALGGEPSEAGAAPQAAYYRAVVRAESQALVHGDKLLPVLPGMVGTADIRVGRRSVASFLLRPMMKAKEAFTER